MLKKLVFGIACVAIIVGIGMGIKVYNRPAYVFKRTFGFDLPSLAKIDKYNRTLFDPSLNLKIQINENECDEIEENLLKYYQQYYKDQTDNSVFNIKNTCSWWDLNTDEIVYKYEAYTKGKRKAFTKYSFSYITKDEKGQYFLYISEFQ